MEDELISRAFRAHFRTGHADQPSRYSSAVETHAGRSYAVLRNLRGVLAVYRVRTDGRLKRLGRWPAVSAVRG